MSDLERAHRFLQQGKYADAAAQCERLLRLRPMHVAALELLGVIRVGVGRFPEGITSLQTAAALNPDKPGLLANLGDALLRAGQAPQAADAFRKAIERCGPSPELFYNLGLALQAAQDSAGAIESYRQCLTLDARIPEAHNNLGTLLDLAGRFAEAIDCFNEALRYRPDYVRALTNLGKVLRQVGKPVEAVASLERALALAPEHAAALGNLGAALIDLSRYDEAIERLRRTLELDPRLAEAHFNLGRALRARGEHAAAIPSLRQAVALNPGLADAQVWLAQAALRDGELLEAIASLQRAIAADPVLAEAHVFLGIALFRAARVEEAVASFERATALDPAYQKAHLFHGWALEALEKLPQAQASYARASALAPDDPETLSSLLNSYMRVCDWTRAEAQLQRVRELPGGVEGINPFVLLGVSDDPAEQLRSSRARAQSIAQDRAPIGPTRHYDHERIRIAYLSRDFFNHATSYLMAELFGLHDRGAFEILGVSYGPDDVSTIRRRIIGSFDEFLDVTTSSDREVAATLLRREVDILVDLKGYTAWARTEILAHRPAPIQVSYLGYPGTMGAPFVDYLIADDFVVPPGERCGYSENIVYLPGSYQVNDRRRIISPATLQRRDFGLPEQGFVFCCFNNNWKITAPMFEVWMRLLRAVHGSVLWLLEGNSWSVLGLREAARNHGVAPERLIFCQRTSNPEHLARQQLADLSLDTLPVNAHTTASDALWAGLPLVSCAGRTFAARVAGSLLRAAGLGDLVAPTLEEYEQLALNLARDPERLRSIRAALLRDRQKLPLFDTPAFCRSLEAAYRKMWLLHQSGVPPADFSIEPM
jgi:protein O-GlcNAc transferase